MSELKDESIHLVVTSPPYWQLKDYGTENQIGFHDDYETYINHLNLTWKECFRVLYKGCRLCINIGDQFARSVYYGRYKIIPIHSEIIKFCEMAGFDFMGSIIWQKTTTMNTTGGASIMGSFPHPRNGIVKLDFEYILLFKKQGDAPKPTPQQKEHAAMTTEEWNTYFNGHWYISGVRQDNHLAMFPEELPKRLIKMFSFPGENILDPFLGSGTTALVAKNLGRNSCGYEINPEFMPIIKQKLGVNDNVLFDDARFDFVKQTEPMPDFEEKIKALPYIFEDTHKLDKKIDVKNRTFDGYIREKSVVNDGLARHYPSVRFEESPPELDHAGDIDYLGYVGEKAFGIQIKPVTAQANFGNYSISDRMRAGFLDFENEYGGKVFIVFSLDGDIANKEILKDIKAEIQRLTQ
jgi:modification methylase